MCAKPGLQLLGCVRRLGGSQRRLAPPHSCGVAPSAPSRFLSTTNGFAVAAPGRHGGSALSSTGRGGELVESWRSLSSLSFRDPRKLQSPLRLEAVDHSVSQQEATSEDPTSRQSHPPNSSSSSSNSSSEDSSNENSSSSSSSSINNNKSNDSVSQSEGREGALGGRDEVAELQRLLRERQQRQADVIPFRSSESVKTAFYPLSLDSCVESSKYIWQHQFIAKATAAAASRSSSNSSSGQQQQQVPRVLCCEG
ncbi:hypothetical protein Emag_000347 [Eimeria magna]